MSLFREAAILLALTLLAAGATHLFHPRAPAWHLTDEPLQEDEVTLEQVLEKWGGEVLWVDARPRDQFDAGHVPGAILLNEQEADDLLFDHFEMLQDNTRPIVIYCDGAACQASHKMKDYLRQRLPIEGIHVLKGGWQAWKNR